MLKQYATRVKFTELRELEGSFEQESVSSGGGSFPKHLIYSYNIRKKTVVFPFGWMIHKPGSINENGRMCPHWKFHFNQYWSTFIQRGLIKKIDLVEIEYDPKDFEPNRKLVKMTLTIPRRNKSRVNKLIQQYLATKTIVAERSRASTQVIPTFFAGKKNDKKKTLLMHTYELILKKSKWKVFVEQLYKQKLIPAKERHEIQPKENVFPKQLACFNK